MTEDRPAARERSSDRNGGGSAPEPEAGQPPFRLPPPLAKRLNRNALTVAAALAGITVITVLVVTRSPRSTRGDGIEPSQTQAAPPVPARPAFLDQPPKAPAVHQPDTARGELGSVRGWARPGTSAVDHASGIAMPDSPGDGAPGLPVPPPIDRPPTTLPAPGPIGSMASGIQGTGPSPRREAYQAALTSSVLVGAQAGPHARPTMTPSATADAPADGSSAPVPVGGALGPPLETDSARGLPAAGGPRPGATGAQPAAGAPPALAPPASMIAVRLDSAGSPYTIRAGTVIPGLLVTGVNSDLPGEVLGQTSRDVYDSRTQHILLVPKGSRLIGSYDNRSVGTGRLIVGWTRLILPDGRSMVLPRLAGTDAQGQAGLHDEVDHHYGRVYGAALLTSAITAGVQLSQPQQTGLYAVPSTREVAAGALGQTMGDVALESTRRGLAIPPTVVIRPGQSFNVFLAGDLAFPSPYRPAVIAQAP